MPTTIELTLSTLLPTISFLPPDLIILSNSLLAQSRAKAASLKTEEEIARTYACCHVACERLKKRLDLEIGRPAPPVKPRVYEKLYKYLDGVLTTPIMPRRERGRAAERWKEKFPSSVGNAVDQRTSTAVTGEEREREEVEVARVTEEQEQEEGVPEFAMPMIRAICKANGTSSAAPHVLVGATAVLQDIVSRTSGRRNDEPPSRKRRRTPQSAKPTTADGTASVSGVALSKWSSLLIALHLLVTAKLRGLDTEDDEMRGTRRKGIEVVREYCREKKDSLPSDIDARSSKLESDVGFYILEGEDYGWLDMEWYQNVPSNDQILADEDDAEMSRVDVDEEDAEPMLKARPYKTPLGRKEKRGDKAGIGVDEIDGAAGLRSGLGTMFQPAVDWLSDERRADYAHWKRSIFREINILEAKS